MARRGFFAELQRQGRIVERDMRRAAKQREQAQRAAIREAERDMREAERAAKAQERAAKARLVADAAERKRLAKASQEAHVAAMQAEVERRNLDLEEGYAEIDSLLAATLEVDDYVDLDALKRPAEHPPFDRTDLEAPVAEPVPVPDPVEPVYNEPAAPTGLGAVLGRRKHARAVAEARETHELRIQAWRERVKEADKARESDARSHAMKEAKRLADLEVEQARYRDECAARDADTAAQHAEIDDLIANLGYGVADAVQEYIAIVLANSIYPSQFEVQHDFSFVPETAELKLRVNVPGPDKVPTEKAYKYTKSADEITATTLSQKAQKDRYASAVHQVALRSLHEVFEADRRGIIQTISLEVGTETIDPATGNETYILFVAVGAERESFLALDLSKVVPAATLDHLGASVSKNPLGLVAAKASGIRRS